MRVVLLMVFLSTGTAAAAACPLDTSYVSSSAKPLPPAAFKGITKAMSVPEIIRRLGPAARDVGSGVYVLQWDVTDGRAFLVSTADACGTPFNVGFHRAGNSDKRKPLHGLTRCCLTR